MGGRRSLRVATIRGVDIRIDVSWLLIAGLITWSYWLAFDARPTHAGAEAFAMAVAGALLFFGSVLAHELAHAFEARHRGVEVGAITLFLFGGVTETRFDVRRPRDEFALTAVGPFTSFVLAAAFGLVATFAAEAGWTPVAAVTGLLAWVNLALGVFNLLPGAPLDGGRILRAGVWWLTRDRDRATRVAARAGQLLGALVLALGLLQVFFAPGALIGGLWLAFIGWFLLKAAGMELAQAELRGALAGVTVGDLLDRRQPLPADAPLSAAADRFRSEDVDVLAVADEAGTVGALDVASLQGSGRDAWHDRTVRDAMQPLDRLPSVEVGEPVGEVVDRLGESGVVVATRDGRAVGIITAQRVTTMLRRSRQLGPSERPPEWVGVGPEGRG